jgi:hypothetical protein
LAQQAIRRRNTRRNTRKAGSGQEASFLRKLKQLSTVDLRVDSIPPDTEFADMHKHELQGLKAEPGQQFIGRKLAQQSDTEISVPIRSFKPEF